MAFYHSLVAGTIFSLLLGVTLTTTHGKSYEHFPIKEATIDQIQAAFRHSNLTSRQLVELYLGRIRELNKVLRAVIEVNPDAVTQAEAADRTRKRGNEALGILHGVPVLLKDNIGTKDKMNTSAGSLALVGSIVKRDAGVVRRLRKAGAIILGKASMTEWGGFRSRIMPDGWCARTGQGLNPYNFKASPHGSSSGPAISVAANLVMVAVGTETDGSVLSPSSANSVVGIKPTVGLTSRAGVVPISNRQGSLGTIGRTVGDAVYVLEAIAGFDPNDAEATKKASSYIPVGGYKQFLKVDGLKGKRIGIVRNPFFNFSNGSPQAIAFDQHFHTLTQAGATLVDHLEIANVNIILNNSLSGEATALLAEFKQDFNAYVADLESSPVRSLADVIAFNQKLSSLEKIKQYGQANFLASETTNGIAEVEVRARENMAKLSRGGFESLMRTHRLDALVAPNASAVRVLSIGGYPGISVPAGYDHDGVPFGICFGGLKGSEPKLIEMAYAFEQVTKIRRPPPM